MTILSSNEFNPFAKSIFGFLFAVFFASKVFAQPCTPPNVTFSFLPVTPQCSGTSINFSVTTPQPNVVYSWSFGDSRSGSGPNTTHRYDTIGNGTISYTVQLTATDTSVAACVSTSSQIVQVRQRPSASIANPTATPFVNCPSGGLTTFNLIINNTSTTAATNTNYNIVWGDGTPNYNAATFPSPPNHTYNSIGFFNLILTVTGSNGCSRTDTFPVFNGANPAVSLGTPGATVGLCTPYIISIPISGTGSNPPGTRYIITKNDGSRNDTLNHPPPANYVDTFFNTSCGASGGLTPNTFFIRIRAVNPCGFSTSTIEPITTNQLPLARMAITPDTIVCVNTVVTFTNTSIAGASVNNSGVCNSTTALNWVVTPAVGWTINSGSLGTNPADPFNAATWGTTPLRLNFTTPGIYQVKLRVQPTNICGYDSVIRTICVQGPPTPSFTSSQTSVCAPAPITFTSTSTNLPVCGPLTYLWTVSKTSFTCSADSAADFVYTSGTTSASINPIIRFNNQGTYSVTLSLTNRCGTFTTAPQVITVRQRPRVTITATPSTICRGQSLTPSISTLLDCGDAITSFNWTFASGSPASSSNQVPGAVTYNTGGNYNINLAVQNLCGTTNATTSVTVNDPPIINAGSDQAVCLNSSPVTVIGSPAGGTWSGTNTTAGGVHTPSTAGVFNLIYTASQNNCPASDTIQMTVNSLPPMTVTPSSAICFGNSTTLTAGGANTYVWNPSGSLSASTGASVTATPTGNTTYTVIGTNSTTNCTASINTTITVNPLPVVNAGADQILCNQPISVNLTGTPAGGAWSGLNITAGGVFTPSGIGVFPVVYTFTNGNNCTNRDTAIITVIDPTIPDAGLDRDVCLNSGAVTLSPTPTGGTWSGTNTTAGGVHTPSSVGTFNLVYTFGNSTCLRRDTLVMTVNPLPTVTISPATAICFGNSTVINAGGANTYAWSPSGSLSASTGAAVTATPTGNTTYSVIGTNTTTNCTASVSTTITVNPLPTVNAGVDRTFCNQPIPVTLTGTPAGGTWSGLHVTSGGVFTPNGLGTFLIEYTFTNANNCTNRDTTFITVIDATVPNAGRDTAFCLNSGSRTLVGTPSGGTWSGTNINAAGVYNPITQGTFDLVYTFGTGTCLLRDTLVMTVNPLPAVTISPATAICVGNSTVLIAGGADTYDWSPSGSLSASTGATVTATPTGNTTYSVTGTEASTACFLTRTVLVTVNPLPVVSAGVDRTFCNQPIPVTLTGTPAGGTWSGLHVTSGGVFTPNGLGTFLIEYTFTDANTCTNRDTTFISVIDATVPNAGRDTAFCLNSGSRTLVGTPSGGIWSGTNINAAGVYNPITQGAFNLVYTFGTGTCLLRDTLVMTVNPLPTLTVTPAPSICRGDSAILSASGADTYVWSPATFLNVTSGPTVISKPTAAITYTVIGTNTTTNCSASLNRNITIKELPVVTLPADQSICEGTASAVVPFSSSVSNTTYEWFGSAISSLTNYPANGSSVSIPSFTPSNSDLVPDDIDYIIIPNADGCIGDTVRYRYTINPIPNVNPISSQAICSGGQTTLVSPSADISAATYTWSSATVAGITGNTLSGSGDIPTLTITNSSNNVRTVVYIVTPSFGGCPGNSTSYNVTVNPAPNVNAIANQTICSGQSTTIVNPTSGVGSATYSWTSVAGPQITGNIASGNGQIPSQVLVNNGSINDTVVYSVSGFANGCNGPARIFSVIVRPTPIAISTPLSDTICSGQDVSITLTSAVPGTTFSWVATAPAAVSGASSGTGSFISNILTSNSTAPQSVVYAITPTANTCVGSVLNDTVTVKRSATVQFTPSLAQTICNNTATQEVAITANTSGASISWVSNVPPLVTGADNSGDTLILSQTLSNGSTTVQQVVYTASVVFQGCQGQSSTYAINVNPTPLITNIDTSRIICSGDSAQRFNFTSNVTGATFAWSTVGNPDLTGYAVSGTGNMPFRFITNTSTTDQTLVYVVTPTFAGCDGVSRTFLITVQPRPTATLTPDSQSVCNNTNSAPIVITSNVTGTQYNWSSSSNISGFSPLSGNSDTIPPILFQYPGIFSDTGYVSFTITTSAVGCPGSTNTAYIQVNPLPTIDFAMSQDFGCSPLNVDFTTNPFVFGNPDSLEFEWGDGTPNTVIFRNPLPPNWRTVSHSFDNSNTQAVSYFIKLTAYNNCGFTEAFDTVTVLPNLIEAALSASNTFGCEPLTVDFSNFSTGAITNSWCFDFDTVTNTCNSNALVSNAPVVQHTFSAGNYTVALYITDGCSNDTAYVQVRVSPSPVAEFAFSANVCDQDAVIFADQSVIPTGLFLASSGWIFGDGGSAVGNNTVSYTYPSPGQYNACHFSTLSNGCTDTICKNVTVSPKPQVDFIGYDTCINSQPIQFVNTSVGASSYIWYFGDGNASPLATPNHVYATPGTYTITLIGSIGTCSDTAIHPVTLHPIPSASFVVPNSFYCGLPLQLQLQNTSSGALFYNWDFGNGSTSSINNPSVTYTAAGTYDILLAASNVFGCIDTAITTIDAYPLPDIQSVDINPSFGCRPLTVTFSTNTVNGNSYVWNFGDGSLPASTSTPFINHVYSDTGRYTVSLSAYSFANCGDTVVLNDTIGVYLPPIADFEFQPNATFEPIDRTIITLNRSQYATSYVWEFSDGGSSTDINPVYTFPTPENYTVTLIAINDYCTDTIVKQTVLFKGSLFVPNAFAPDYAGNGDLVRVWQPIGIGLATYRAQVFNTWGELIWESTRLDNTKPVEFWDGTYRGNICPQDVYVWKVDAVFIDGGRWDGMAYEKGGKKTTIGSITLVR
jgi:PKD repeat protein